MDMNSYNPQRPHQKAPKRSKGPRAFIDDQAVCGGGSDDEIIPEATDSDIEFINDNEDDL